MAKELASPLTLSKSTVASSLGRRAKLDVFLAPRLKAVDFADFELLDQYPEERICIC